MDPREIDQNQQWLISLFKNSKSLLCREDVNEGGTTSESYQSVKLTHFLSQYHITHTFGIPYNSQGQAIIERANHTLHEYLEKIKKGGSGEIYET